MEITLTLKDLSPFSLSMLGSIACLMAESQLTHVPFMEIDNKIISAVILSLPLIQEGQLSVTGKSMCTNICCRPR